MQIRNEPFTFIDENHLYGNDFRCNHLENNHQSISKRLKDLNGCFSLAKSDLLVFAEGGMLVQRNLCSFKKICARSARFMLVRQIPVKSLQKNEFRSNK